MSRFDTREGEKYGVCVTCGIQLATAAEAKEHRMKTLEESVDRKSHSTVGSDRESRIQSHIDSAVESAISDALDDLQGDVDRGDLTEDEVAEGLRWHSEFLDAWKGGN